MATAMRPMSGSASAGQMGMTASRSAGNLRSAGGLVVSNSTSSLGTAKTRPMLPIRVPLGGSGFIHSTLGFRKKDPRQRGMSMKDRCRELDANLLKNKEYLDDHRGVIDWAMQAKKENDARVAEARREAGLPSDTELVETVSDDICRGGSTFSMKQRCDILEENMHRAQYELEDRRKVIDRALEKKRQAEAAVQAIQAKQPRPTSAVHYTCGEAVLTSTAAGFNNTAGFNDTIKKQTRLGVLTEASASVGGLAAQT